MIVDFMIAHVKNRVPCFAWQGCEHENPDILPRAARQYRRSVGSEPGTLRQSKGA
jgi:hypothetical protein